MYLKTVLIRFKNKTEKSDEKLLEIFRETGDTEVLATLFNRYIHLVYGVCMKYLKNRENSQDAVIEIYEHISKQIPNHKIQTFKNWLYGVTRNHCLMQLRKEKSRSRNFEDYSRSINVENTEKEHPIDDRKDNNLLKSCIAQLKIIQKRCVELFYYEQQCYREIAEELGIEEKKVKSQLQNAKRNLRICMEKKKEYEAS